MNSRHHGRNAANKLVSTYGKSSARGCTTAMGASRFAMTRNEIDRSLGLNLASVMVSASTRHVHSRSSKHAICCPRQ